MWLPVKSTRSKKKSARLVRSQVAIIIASKPELMIMRTTIDLPESDHALFRALARARGVSLSSVIIDLCKLGLRRDSEEEQPYKQSFSSITGLPTISSAKPVTNAQIADFLNKL